MSMASIVWALILAFVAGILWGGGPALLGAVLGFMIGVVSRFGGRLTALEKRLDAAQREFRQRLATLEASPRHPPAPEASVEPGATPQSAPAEFSFELEPAAAPREEAAATEAAPVRPGAVPPKAPARPLRPPPAAPKERKPGPVDHVVNFFTQGNPVVRIGMVVLFFGVSFLVKYAAEHNVFPIELRLSAVALASLAVLVLGWRLRERPGNYGLVLQGGAVGVLYMTVYAATKLYGLIPAGFAFGMMVALVVLSGILAVLQEARTLALFGSAGGFLAPVLASTGGGSHVMLFSYYALLNCGILGIAWFRAWRELNVLGFVLTFVIGALWGHRYYRPEHFATVEPFLILFFLFYVAIAVLFAQRQKLELKGYVDATLVFGVPLVGFGLQYALVRDFEYGLAYSALILGAFYIPLATVLWRRQAEGMRLLTETFLALGVVFASLAVPLALDGRWTAATWALEGAAMVWVGVRQQRRAARLFGVLLQFGAGVAFLVALGDPVRGLPVWNGIFLGAMVVSWAGLFSAWYLQRVRAQIGKEADLSLPLLAWGLIWWLGAGWREIDAHLAGPDEVHALVLFLALSALVMGWLAARLQWREIAFPPLGLLPLSGLILLGQAGMGNYSHPFTGWGAIAWSCALGANYRLLWRQAGVWPEQAIRFWHAMGLWLILFLFSWELDWGVRQALPHAETWRTIAWAVVPALGLTGMLKWGDRIAWPVARYRESYLALGLAPVALYLLLWVVAACLRRGDPSPLPYLVLLNPMDLAQAFVLLALAKWLLWSRGELWPAPWRPPAHASIAALALAGFLWLNAVLARAVHFWLGVSYSQYGLYRSVVFQAAASILWTVVALLVMVMATRTARRQAWFVGAALLAVAVVKLFAVDLAGIGTVARIVSFLAVGGLMLVIGYFSPLPPRNEETTP